MFKRLLAVTGLMILVSGSVASAAYSSNASYNGVYRGQIDGEEFSGVVASPNYPGWYWAQADVWKTDDSFAACSGLSGNTLDDCRKTVRASLYAFQISNKQITNLRRIAINSQADALDPNAALNGDWEDLSTGPLRQSGESFKQTLLIGVLGNASNNPITENGQNITCDTRKLIELDEPDPTDPNATWSVRKLFDIEDWTGLGNAGGCNSEAMAVAEDQYGVPTAYFVNRNGRQVLSRSLDESTGRLPGDARNPQVMYHGKISGVVNNQAITGMTYSSGRLALIGARNSSTNKCNLLTGFVGSSETIASVLTSGAVAVTSINCQYSLESLTHLHDSDDLLLVADNRKLRYSLLFWQPQQPAGTKRR